MTKKTRMAEITSYSTKPLTNCIVYFSRFVNSWHVRPFFVSFLIIHFSHTLRYSSAKRCHIFHSHFDRNPKSQAQTSCIRILVYFNIDYSFTQTSMNVAWEHIIVVITLNVLTSMDISHVNVKTDIVEMGIIVKV